MHTHARMYVLCIIPEQYMKCCYITQLECLLFAHSKIKNVQCVNSRNNVKNLIDEVKELDSASTNSRAPHFGGPTNQTSFVDCSFTRSDTL